MYLSLSLYIYIYICLFVFICMWLVRGFRRSGVSGDADRGGKMAHDNDNNNNNCNKRLRLVSGMSMRTSLLLG